MNYEPFLYYLINDNSPKQKNFHEFLNKLGVLNVDLILRAKSQKKDILDFIDNLLEKQIFLFHLTNSEICYKHSDNGKNIFNLADENLIFLIGIFIGKILTHKIKASRLLILYESSIKLPSLLTQCNGINLYKYTFDINEIALEVKEKLSKLGLSV